MPGLVVTLAALSVLSVTAQSIARERELGTFDQLMVSPMRVHGNPDRQDRAGSAARRCSTRRSSWC